MDSYFHGKINHKLKEQICSIVRYDKSPLQIKVVPEQQQGKMSLDCGLFTLAFIQYILDSKDIPSAVSFDQAKMRHHVLRALAANKLGLFPRLSESKTKRNKEKHIDVELFCNCRLPWSPNDNSRPSR